MSQATIRKYHKLFKNEGYLKEDEQIDDPLLGKRLKTDVSAIPDTSKLELDHLSILLLGIDENNKMMEIVEKIQHLPFLYRIYRIRIPQNSLLIQFLIPEEMIEYISKLFERFEHLGLFNQVSLNNSKLATNSKFNFQMYILDTGNLKVDTNRPDLMKIFSNEVLKSEHFIDVQKQHLTLDTIDIKLLRELEINGNVKLTSIEGTYDIDISTISRRLKFLRENVVEDYRVDLRSEKFGFERYVIFGKGRKNILESTFQLINDDTFWFDSYFSYRNNEFIWLLLIMPEDFNIIIEFLEEITSSYLIIPIFSIQRIPLMNPSLRDIDIQKWETPYDKYKVIDNYLFGSLSDEHIIPCLKPGFNIERLTFNQVNDTSGIFLEFIDLMEKLKETEITGLEVIDNIIGQVQVESYPQTHHLIGFLQTYSDAFSQPWLHKYIIAKIKSRW